MRSAWQCTGMSRTWTEMTYTPELRQLYCATASWSSVIITMSIMPARWLQYHTAAEYTHLKTCTHTKLIHNFKHKVHVDSLLVKALYVDIQFLVTPAYINTTRNLKRYFNTIKNTDIDDLQLCFTVFFNAINQFHESRLQLQPSVLKTKLKSLGTTRCITPVDHIINSHSAVTKSLR